MLISSVLSFLYSGKIAQVMLQEKQLVLLLAMSHKL